MAEIEIKHNSDVDEKENFEKKTIDSLIGLLEECYIHLLKPKALEKSMVLKCIHLKYDKDKINLDLTNIDTGDLFNSKAKTMSKGEGRLKKYSGTCSTESLLRLGCPQYWETETKVTLNDSLARGEVILEVGLCVDGERDKKQHVADLQTAYSLKVVQSKEYNGICWRIKKKGEYFMPPQPATIPIKQGKLHTLHYGVVYDDVRKKIVFIDVDKNTVMSTLDKVDSSQRWWPMFGVSSSKKGTVIMKLVVGKDINMTEEKKALILKALSS